jgi:hypothetical protein
MLSSLELRNPLTETSFNYRSFQPGIRYEGIRFKYLALRRLAGDEDCGND